MTLDIQESDLNWLHREYPSLVFTSGNPSIIKGMLEFDMLYEGDHYVIKPGDLLKSPKRIKDSYEIEIRLENIQPSTLPQVREIGGRLLAVKEKYQKQFTADVHMYANGTLCLCAFPEEKTKLSKGFNLKDFFEYLLIPFFYAQSYYEKYGQWIWGERSHGPLGLLESYADNRVNGDNKRLIQEYLDDLKRLPESKPFIDALLEKDKVKGHRDCFCGSKIKLRRCHSVAFQGLWHFKEDIRKHKIIIRDAHNYSSI